MKGESNGDMKQYCRYCVNLYCGLSTTQGWCQAHMRYYQRSTCFSANKCKDFVMAKCEPEYMDAFYENTKGYKPQSERRRYKIDDGEQERFL